MTPGRVCSSTNRWARASVLLRAAVSSVAALLAAACDRAADPATPTRPRVVALGPAIARTIADAGHADLLVGRHAFDVWTDPALPVCGDQGGVDYEALLNVHPTHVLLQWGQRELPPRLQRFARERGWVVRSYPLLSLSEVAMSSDELWQMFRTESDARPTEPPSTTLAAALDGRTIDASAIGRVLLLAGVNPPTALGPGSYHHDMLMRLGIRPAITDGAPYIVLDAEDLLRLAPDAIVLVQPRFLAGQPTDNTQAIPRADALARARLGHLARLDLPALRRNRIALLDDPMAFVPGSNLVQVAQALRAIFEEWGGASQRGTSRGGCVTPCTKAPSAMETSPDLVLDPLR